MSQRPALTRGFTLVEMLVVLVLLGVLATFVTVRLERDDRRTLQVEATRLATALESAITRAQWYGTTLGLSASGGGYRFVRRDGDDQWHVITDDEMLSPHALPEPMRIHPERYSGAAVNADAVLPLRASGRNEPFEVVLSSREAYARVSTDPLNRINVAIGVQP